MYQKFRKRQAHLKREEDLGRLRAQEKRMSSEGEFDDDGTAYRNSQCANLEFVWRTVVGNFAFFRAIYKK